MGIDLHSHSVATLMFCFLHASMTESGPNINVETNWTLIGICVSVGILIILCVVITTLTIVTVVIRKGMSVKKIANLLSRSLEVWNCSK